MKKTWKMFVTDTGLNSYQNEMLEQRDFYRVLVFLQNNFRGRISEKKAGHKSFLYFLVNALQQEKTKNESENNRNQVEENDGNIRIYYIDDTPIYIGWCACSGVSITAQNTTGNQKITEIAGMIQDHDIWWNR